MSSKDWNLPVTKKPEDPTVAMEVTDPVIPEPTEDHLPVNKSRLSRLDPVLEVNEPPMTTMLRADETAMVRTTPPASISTAFQVKLTWEKKKE